MNRLVAYALVAIAAATPWLEVLLVVPAAILAGLAPVPVVVLAAAGNIVTIVPAVLLADRIRTWLRRRRSTGDDETVEPARAGRGQRVMERYGLPGLALLGPLVTGIHVAALVAIGAGANRRSTLYWLSLGVLVWSIVMAAITVVGLELVIDPDRLPTLFGDVAFDPQVAMRSAIQSTQAV